MNFDYRRFDYLPRLAWCAEIERGSKNVKVLHGPWVEAHKNFFLEGAWDGTFNEGNFPYSIGCFGTGGKIEDNKVVFSTPCHVHEQLNMVRSDDRIVISPSISFLLKRTKSRLDYNYIPYQVDLLNMILEMKNHNGSIPLMGGGSINVYHYRNIVIDSQLNIDVQHKMEPPEFADFKTYKAYVIETLRRLHANATSNDRKVIYAPISMISTGYDSTASSVLAMEIGLKSALTFRTARGADVAQEGPRDSAKNICDALGIGVKEFDRLEVLKRKDYPEAEFVASGDLGQDFEISVLESELENKIVITGYHGDKVWDCNASKIKKDILRAEAGGGCWTDFKFRVGYVFVPVPYIGCLSHPSIHKISISNEMRPWRVWTRYDRSIPRRIVEEKGVDRSLFGQKKKAISILLNSEKTLDSLMSKNSVAAFNEFYSYNKNKRRPLMQWWFNIMYRIYFANFILFSYPNRIFSYFGIPIQLKVIIPGKYSQNPGRPSFLFHWGISVIGSRYEIK